MCPPVRMNFHFNPLPLTAPSAASCAGTYPRRFFSVGQTNSSPASSGSEAGDVRRGRGYAPNQPGHGLPRRVPDCRYPAGVEKQVDVRVVITSKTIEESVDLAYEIFNRGVCG